MRAGVVAIALCLMASSIVKADSAKAADISRSCQLIVEPGADMTNCSKSGSYNTSASCALPAAVTDCHADGYSSCELIDTYVDIEPNPSGPVGSALCISTARVRGKN